MAFGLSSDPIADAFEEGLAGEGRPDYKDPMDPKYFGPVAAPEGMPESEDDLPRTGAPLWVHFAWTGTDGYLNPERDGASLEERRVDLSALAAERKAVYERLGVHDFEPGKGLLDEGCEMAALGAKGSAKSFTFGLACVHRIQIYPGIKIGLVANSYDQAFGSGAEKLVDICRAMGVEFEFRGEMTIDGKKHRNVYYFPQHDAKVCVLSFDNINLIEGTEWDGFWFEEIQDCAERDVTTAMSRARRGTCPRFFFFAGMPDDENHWMYAFFSERAIPIYEPPLKENIHNVPSSYIADLYRTYRGQDVERYIEGKRVALFRQKVFPVMRWSIHVESELSERLCVYDPYRELYISFDFNVAPMCVLLMQIKEWDFEHRGRLLTKSLLCQVDEYELWNATTGAMMELVLADYSGHAVGGEVVGDATGNRRDTRSPGLNDWIIIKRAIQPMPNMVAVPGLVRTRKKKAQRGEPRIAYKNPGERETIVLANSVLIDGDGDPRVLFMPESKYPSGGAARAMAAAKYNMLSKIDESNDQKEDRKLPRTHFVDATRYLIWRIFGKNGRLSGESGMSAKAREELARARKAAKDGGFQVPTQTWTATTTQVKPTGPRLRNERRLRRAQERGRDTTF